MPKCQVCGYTIPSPGVICETCYVEQLQTDLATIRQSHRKLMAAMRNIINHVIGPDLGKTVGNLQRIANEALADVEYDSDMKKLTKAQIRRGNLLKQKRGNLLKHLRNIIDTAIDNGYDKPPFAIPMSTAELVEIIEVFETIRKL